MFLTQYITFKRSSPNKMEQVLLRYIECACSPPQNHSDEVIDIAESKASPDDGLDDIVCSFEFSGRHTISNRCYDELAVAINFTGQLFKFRYPTFSCPLEPAPKREAGSLESVLLEHKPQAFFPQICSIKFGA